MSTVLRIYQQNFKDIEGIREITLTEIESIYDIDEINDLQREGNKWWHVESECGAEFELAGEQINNILGQRRGDSPSYIKDEIYRCSLSF